MDIFPVRPPVEVAEASDVEHLNRLRGAARFTTIAGATYSVLFLISFWLMLDVPRTGASQSEIQSFYASDKVNLVSLVSIYLLPFAGIAFLWFIVSVRMWIGLRATRPLNMLVSNVQMVAGIIFLALLFSSAAALSMGPVTVDLVNGNEVPAVAVEFSVFGGSLFFVFAIRMGAMFVFTTTTLCRSAAIIPKWFVWVSLAVGVIMLLSFSFNRGMILVFPLWVLALCILTQLHVRTSYAQRLRELETLPPADTTTDVTTGQS